MHIGRTVRKICVRTYRQTDAPVAVRHSPTGGGIIIAGVVVYISVREIQTERSC